MDTAASTSLLGIVSTLAWLVSLGGYAATIGIIAVVVRRHRPDAYGGILFWAIGSLVVGIFTSLLTWVMQWVYRGDGVSAVLGVQTVITAIGMPLHIGLLVVFLRGLVKLAQPPPPVRVDGLPPYR